MNVRKDEKEISGGLSLQTSSLFCGCSIYYGLDGGLIGKEARSLLKTLTALLAANWEKIYSEVCGYVNARMSMVAQSSELLVSVSVDLAFRRAKRANAASRSAGKTEQASAYFPTLVSH